MLSRLGLGGRSGSRFVHVRPFNNEVRCVRACIIQHRTRTLLSQSQSQSQSQLQQQQPQPLLIRFCSSKIKSNSQSKQASGSTSNAGAVSNAEKEKKIKTNGKWGDKVKELKQDPPLLLMNLGAIVSLSGFMMTDILFLRLMSMAGGMCGMTYNFTRKPKQMNAVAWGVVFFLVNLVNVIRLILERKEPKFSAREYKLFQQHFEDLQPFQFAKLMAIGTWMESEREEILVEAGKPFRKVIMLHEGSAAAHPVVNGKEQASEIYTYEGDGTNGCVLGGTAIVDPTVTTRNYPNNVRVKGAHTTHIIWDLDELTELMTKEKQIKSAFINSLYVDLLFGLRRHRHLEKEKKKLLLSPSGGSVCHHATADRLLAYRSMIEKAISTTPVSSEAKRSIIRFAESNNIATSQHEHILTSFGWTLEDWFCSDKEVKVK